MNYLRKLVAPVGESSLRWHSLLSFSSLPTPPGAERENGTISDIPYLKATLIRKQNIQIKSKEIVKIKRQVYQRTACCLQSIGWKLRRDRDVPNCMS